MVLGTGALLFARHTLTMAIGTIADTVIAGDGQARAELWSGHAETEVAGEASQEASPWTKSKAAALSRSSVGNIARNQLVNAVLAQYVMGRMSCVRVPPVCTNTPVSSLTAVGTCATGS
jgi:hypothetical protein